jgi:hypothetical protein
MKLPKATQSKYPWQTTFRTVFQAGVGLCAMAPLIVEASGADQKAGAVAVGLTVSGAVTRVMAIPQVNDWLNTYIPWLGAGPSKKQFEATEAAVAQGSAGPDDLEEFKPRRFSNGGPAEDGDVNEN